MRNTVRSDKKDKRRYLTRIKHAKDARLQCRFLAAGCLFFFLVLCILRPQLPSFGDGRGKEKKPRGNGMIKESKNLSGDEIFSKQSRLVGDSAQSRISTDAEENPDLQKERQSNVGFVEENICDRRNYPAEKDLITGKITILINGFSESRLSLLQQNVQFYSALQFVDSIYILWGNTSTPENFLQNFTVTSFGAPIYIVRQSSMSLNDRFLPRSYVNTTAVMICDDDITIDTKSLEFAVDVWRDNQDRIVGFFPRSHAYDYESKAWMYVRHYKSYSIMLTKLMILATRFLYLYTCEMPSGVKEYVDAGMNCEDIAMNFLVSSHSNTGPMLVEGTARDWGDPRNSAVKKHTFSDSALSGRKDHRKDRGDCITAFEQLWHGMKLHLTYSKASSDLENQIQCEKFGYLMDCDSGVASKRDARRQLGEHKISAIQRFAYATFVSSDRFLNSSLLLAQSLRSTGTIHDLVLLLNYKSCGPISESHALYNHFDEVVNVSLPTGPEASLEHGKLRAWLLLDYVKVVYVEVDSLVVANLDHLFQLPEAAAAPGVFIPDKFSTGLLVLKPSNDTYARLLQSLEKTPVSGGKNMFGLLNSVFDGWFERPAEYRLPVRYNVPVIFPRRLTFPSWFDLDRLDDIVGPLMVVRYGNAKLTLQYEEMDGMFENPWWVARAKLFQLLLRKELIPFEADENVSWAPVGVGASLKHIDSIWPPLPLKVSPTSESAMTTSSQRAADRQAFVTVLDGSLSPTFPLVGWAESFHRHHSFPSRTKTLLLVLSHIDTMPHVETFAYYDEVRFVEPFIINGRAAHHTFTLLHLWNLTDFDKVVFVSATSIFVDNCNFLLDYSPFAAVPSLFPPDTFSTQVMSLRPDRHVFKMFKRKLTTSDFLHHPIERFLNSFYSDWYPSSTAHRISPSYAVSVAFENHLQSFGRPWKILSFSLDWLPDQKDYASKLWKMLVCNIEPPKKPELVRSFCGDMSHQDVVLDE